MSPSRRRAVLCAGIGCIVLAAGILVWQGLRTGPGWLEPPVARMPAPPAGAAAAEDPESLRVVLPAATSPLPPDASAAGHSTSDGIVEDVIVDPREVYADLFARFADRRLALRTGTRAIPPDPIDTGHAALVLRLVDDVTRQPIGSTVQIWRLDAPASETWSAGPQQQAELQVPPEGLRHAGLAPGTYRVLVHAAGRSGVSPPAFEVRALEEQRELPVSMPQRFPIHLAVYRLDGTRIELAAIRDRDSGESHPVHPMPAWARGRIPTHHRPGAVETTMSGSDSTAVRAKGFARLVAGADGFPIGPIPECRRDETRFRILDVEVSPFVGPTAFRYRPDVRCRGLVTVAVAPADVARCLRRADGTRVPALADGLAILPEVLPLGDAPAGERWRDVPVVVRVALAGHESLEFRFTARDLPLRERWLRRSR